MRQAARDGVIALVIGWATTLVPFAAVASDGLTAGRFGGAPWEVPPSIVRSQVAEAALAQALHQPTDRGGPKGASANSEGTLSAAGCAAFLTDAGACLDTLGEKAKPGYRLTYPAPDDGSCIPWKTPARIGVEVVIDFGRTHFCAAGLAAPLLSIAASHVSLVGGRFSGDRTSGQTVLSVTGSQAIVQGLSCETVDICVEQPRGAGFYNLYRDVFARNVATAVLHFEDGVGPIVLDMQYDTDNRQWAPGVAASYDVPRKGCLWVQTEGLIFSELNATHCGDGLRIETTAYRHIEWLKGTNSYLDSGVGGAGVHLVNDQTGKKPGTEEQIRLRGLFFDNVWSATNTWGLLIEGRGTTDGVFWRGGEIHNNLREGVRIDSPAATNIVLDGTVLSGNNAAGEGASNLFTNTAGFVSCRACFFGRMMEWTAMPYDQVLTGEAQSGVVDLSGSRFDVAGVKHFVLDKHGAGRIDIGNVEGVIAHARGSAVIPAGEPGIDVDPGLNVPYALGDIMVSPAAATTVYVAGLHPSKSGQTFRIDLPKPRRQATTVTWDVDVRSL